MSLFFRRVPSFVSLSTHDDRTMQKPSKVHISNAKVAQSERYKVRGKEQRENEASSSRNQTKPKTKTSKQNKNDPTSVTSPLLCKYLEQPPSPQGHHPQQRSRSNSTTYLPGRSSGRGRRRRGRSGSRCFGSRTRLRHLRTSTPTRTSSSSTNRRTRSSSHTRTCTPTPSSNRIPNLHPVRPRVHRIPTHLAGASKHRKVVQFSC